MAKKVRVTSEQYKENWQKGMSGAGDKYKRGVMAVEDNPCALAADQVEVWAQNTIAAKSKFESSLRKVSKSDWQAVTSTKGVTALQNSVTAALPKVKASGERVIAAMNDALSDLPPRGVDLNANLQRVAHIARKMQEAFK